MRLLMVMIFVLCGFAFSQSSSENAVDAKFESLQKVLQTQNSSQSTKDAQAYERIKSPDLKGIAIRMTISLMVVLLLLFILYRVARKVKHMDASSKVAGKNIRILENHYIGSQQRVFLMRIGSKVIVVGATADSMHTLATLEGDEASLLIDTPQMQTVSSAQFSETVNSMLKHFRKETT